MLVRHVHGQRQFGYVDESTSHIEKLCNVLHFENEHFEKVHFEIAIRKVALRKITFRK